MDTLARAAEGDQDAAEELYPVVYDELRRIANARLRGERSGHTLQPTALVNEAFLRVIGQSEAHISSKSPFCRYCFVGHATCAGGSCSSKRYAKARW